ncbi:MAG: type I DNA topoisomerase [Aeriscardovia sp.]|nr:type I DNA topoisomerase [Aeriscardovia sp.]
MATGTKLVIVESPTKAAKIQEYLGPEYTVAASVGHIRDLAQPSQVPTPKKAKFGKFGVNVDDGFDPYYIINANKRDTVSKLKKALANASELYLATDEDREGEAIAWHLIETLKPKVPVKRMVFHEITKQAILASLEQTRQVDQHMVSAQETRRILDRLYGYELSPVLWRKVAPKLSAGRVQSVATRLIVERECERMAFVPAQYRDLVAMFMPSESDVNSSSDSAFEARLISLAGRRLTVSKDFDARGNLTAKATADEPIRLSEQDARRLADELLAANFEVRSLERKLYRRHPSPPFTTSTLQQAAGNRLGMTSRATMRAAQGLYENGYITYMRTDSVTLSSEAIQAARQSVEERFGAGYLSEKPRQFATTSAGAQEAHEAIRPAGSTFRSPDEIASRVPPEQLRLYTLIWQRTLATQMADTVGFTATARIAATAPSFGEALFQASGTVVSFSGFSRVYAPGNGTSSGKSAGKSEETRLPDLSEGQHLTLQSVDVQTHQTQPQPRYTEASLVKTLEAKEIGRPSTYASIISTIIDRGYVYERGRALIPSWLAFCVVKLLETKFPKLIDYEFTAHMENGLDRIAQGEESELDWLTKFYFGHAAGSVQDEQEAADGLQAQVSQLGDIDVRAINTIDIGDGVHVRVGRYGPYVEDTKDLSADGTPRRASVPDGIAPDELTAGKARELIASNSSGTRVLGNDEDGTVVEVRSGRFGPYVTAVMPGSMEQVHKGESTPVLKKGKASTKMPKPRVASLFKTMDPATITLDQALALLNLPRVVGQCTEKNEHGEDQVCIITANNGRYGPYLTKTIEGSDAKPETRPLDSQDDIFTVTLQEATEKFAQPKYSRSRAPKPPLRELGADPATGRPVVIKDGFYGTYITDGITNRTIPKSYTVESLDPQTAFDLLAQKRAQGTTKRRSRRTSTSSVKKTGAKKLPTRKTASTKKAVTTTAEKAET